MPHRAAPASLIESAFDLTMRNTRRYGGYIVHIAIVMLFIGFTGAAFNKDATSDVKVGDKFQIGRYELKIRDLLDGENENFTWRKAAASI